LLEEQAQCRLAKFRTCGRDRQRLWHSLTHGWCIANPTRRHAVSRVCSGLVCISNKPANRLVAYPKMETGSESSKCLSPFWYGQFDAKASAMCPRSASRFFTGGTAIGGSARVVGIEEIRVQRRICTSIALMTAIAGLLERAVGYPGQELEQAFGA